MVMVMMMVVVTMVVVVVVVMVVQETGLTRGGAVGRCRVVVVPGARSLRLTGAEGRVWRTDRGVRGRGGYGRGSGGATGANWTCRGGGCGQAGAAAGSRVQR